MSALSIIILVFSGLGAIDYLIGNKIGMGEEFKKAFSMFTAMALSMLGIIVVAPAIGVWLTPFFEWFYNVLGLDPSIIPASLFANDMGGTTLAQAICKSTEVGNYNAFIVSSMMGCVISFTIPFSLGVVKKELHKNLFFGLLCGIATIPTGSFVAGIMCGLNVIALLLNLLPLIIFSSLVILFLIFLPEISIKCFSVFGFIMKALSIIGLACAIFTFLTKIEVCSYFDSLENAAFICVNACVTLSGALPLMFVVSKLLNRPLTKLGGKIGINGISAVSLLGTMVTNASTFGVMEKMDKKGAAINSAFAVSAAFVFGSHLAFTQVFDGSYILPMIVGKIISGICAIILVLVLYKEKTEDVA